MLYALSLRIYVETGIRLAIKVLCSPSKNTFLRVHKNVLLPVLCDVAIKNMFE